MESESDLSMHDNFYSTIVLEVTALLGYLDLDTSILSAQLLRTRVSSYPPVELFYIACIQQLCTVQPMCTQLQWCSC